MAMNTKTPKFLPLLTALFLPLLILVFLLQSVAAETAVGQQASAYPTVYPDEFGYGFNVANWDVPKLQNMGFNWIKVFNAPGSRLPLKVLLRVEANSSHMANLSGFGSNLANLAQSQKGFIDAYEIGNEPNLDASYGWTIAPNAADYATLLCTAYNAIKSADPNAIVVSAGLAPTGRVQGEPGWPPGHNGRYQDEREFFKEFLDAGGGDCLDAVGYHNYGFSADFDIVPDSVGDGWGTPTYCGNGFCFRGVEKIYEIMQNYGLVEKQVWTTEFGWIVEPPQVCRDSPTWSGRLWQIVSEQKQADNLVGAYQYARANYPWLGAMFVFNLNFNLAGYSECEQMRYYGVQGRQADGGLTAMAKDYTLTPPHLTRLVVTPAQWSLSVPYGSQPYTATVPLEIANTGSVAMDWALTELTGGNLALDLGPTTSGVLAANASVQIPVTVTTAVSPAATYTATLHITATEGTLDAPVSVPLALTIEPPIQRMAVTYSGMATVITPDAQPITRSWDVVVANVGDLPFDWGVTAVADTLTPTLGAPSSGTLAPATSATFPVTITTNSLTVGRYSATLAFTATNGTEGVPAALPIDLFIFDTIYSTYLPVIFRN